MKVTRKDNKIQALRQVAQGLGDSTGAVGWFPSAVYEGGQPVAGVAYVQEFGAPGRGIPSRSFFRATVSERRNDWSETSRQIARNVMQGKLPPSAVAEAVSLAAEGHVRQTITKITSPPLAPATVAARKRRLADGGASAQASIAKPLVDTAIMLNTLTSQVEKK